MKKEINIVAPEGYEIDKENSTFECIKFKPIEKKRWRDNEEESGDEKIRGKLLQWLKLKLSNPKVGFVYEEMKQWIAWLEKQGKICHSIMWHSVFEEPEEMQELLCEWESNDATWHEVAFYHADTKTFWNGERQVEDVIKWIYINELFEKQGESKFESCIQDGDKIVTNDDGTHFNVSQLERVAKKEPKFKVGDWITDGNITIQIEAIKNDCYLYCGDCALYSIKTADKVYHLWTLKDAKDGDVLQLGNVTAIFKEFICSETCRCYCSCEEEFEIPLDNDYDNVYGCYNTTPATKEQRDLLFQKMKEAGYEWDAEKKELKKIHVIDEGKAEMDYCFTKMMNGEKINLAWSEEDEIGLSDALWTIRQARTIAKNENDMGNLWYAENWLKGLKDRVKPQWKPSKGQLNALNALNLHGDISYVGQQKQLVELYEQLKKL